MSTPWLVASRKPVSRADAVNLLFESVAFRSHIQQRFNRLAIRGHGKSDCWGWIGSLTAQGYGRLSVYSGIELRAHRAAYALFIGRPELGCVCHRCDNPTCSNPRHLFDGTRADNIHDMDAKGRAKRPRIYGNRHSARVTIEEVAEIRRVYRPAHPVFGQQALGRRFGLTQSAISLIVLNKTHVTAEGPT